MTTTTPPVQGFGHPAHPSTVVSSWTECVAATPITSNPFTQAASGDSLKPRDAKGIEVMARLEYDATGAVTQQVKGYIRGRSSCAGTAPGAVNNVGPWQILCSRDGTKEIELTTAADDMTTRTGRKATTVNPDKHIAESQGCDEFDFVVTQALTMNGGGTATLARVQMKVV